MRGQESISANLTALYEQLRISEEQFRGAFEHAAIGMAIVGQDGKWIEANKSLCEMLGYSSQEMMKLTFQDVTHPEDLNKDISSLNKLIGGEGDSYKMEKRYFHKNGEIIFAILSVSIVRDQHRKPLHFVAQMVDITEMKKTEYRLKMLLEVTNDKNARLLNFSHIVSHNLRSHSTNLSMLINFLELEEDEAGRKEMFEILKKAASNLEDTTAHLTEIAVPNHSLQDNLKYLDLKGAVNNALCNVQALLRETGGICIDNLDKDIMVKVIPAYIDSAILNLLTNAIKYRSNERKLVIEINSVAEGSFIVLSVRDNGSGIDLKANGHQIFGMHKTFHTNKDARGVGLFITRNQVEGMGGKVIVESEPDQGTVFKLYLKRG